MLILLGGLAYLLVSRWRRSLRSQAPKPPGQDKVANMVACAHCGVNLPEGEALVVNGHHFCCASHRDQGPATKGSQRQ
jgi:uncharacterized protein